MQIIGFNFTKINAERSQILKRSGINTNIEFTDLEKDKVDFLKEGEVIKLSFSFSVKYESSEEKDKKKSEDPSASISFKGMIVLSVSKEESKDLQKSWKKKELPPALQIPLYNFILKKCSTKALNLEEDLNLPPHIPVPQIKAKEKAQD